MRIKRLFFFLLTIPIIFTWIITSYVYFPSKGQQADVPKVRTFLKRLTNFEERIRSEFVANQASLHELEQNVDRRIEEVVGEKGGEHEVYEQLKQLPAVFGGTVMPVLVIACNRVTVTRCLDQLIKYRPDEKQFPIIVSQDCQDAQTKSAIQKYGEKVILIEQPDQSDIKVPPKEKKFKGYFKIARHYGWALNQIFFYFRFETVIIVEDDLDISPDFFDYFNATYPLLKNDPSLMCVSAWNDNGKSNLVDLENGASQLYRTDFFPGLGWMLTQDVWKELSPIWPKSYWDDWIRQPDKRKGRACIRPEISRTRTFGKIGVSQGLFYEKHLKYIHLNSKYVPFSKMDLGYLYKDNYDKQFVREVYQQSTEFSFLEYKAGNPSNFKDVGAIRIPYTRKTFKTIAKYFGLMDDFRSGVPRTGYKGVITFYLDGITAYLVPPADWKGYDPTWS